MLTVTSGGASPDCTGVSCRDFLRVGALGLAGLTLPGLLATRARAAEAGSPSFLRDKAVVLLYLSGGASHIETFNPNMGAPAPYRSLTGEVKTTLPGVSFGGTFPQLARLAHRMAVVRSFRHSVGDHDAAHRHVLSAGTDVKGDGTQGQSMGSVYARLRGTSNPKTGMPSYVLSTHPEVDGQSSKELDRVIRGSSPGGLGPACAPFRLDGDGPGATAGRKAGKPRKQDDNANAKPGKAAPPPPPAADGSVAEDMALTLPQERLDDRRALLHSLDRMRRDLDSSGRLDAADRFEQQAFDLVLGSARDAFDLSKEDPHLVERYDTSGTKVGHKQFRPSTLGRQMLLARRLVEAGCGFCTVHSAG